jgi:DNA modification methylase
MLLHGDCLKLMPTLGDNSVDMVLVDLPYGVTKCKWDIAIDLDEMWVQLKRICKPNANLVFFCTTKFGNKLINSNEKWFRYDLVWEKPNPLGFLDAKLRPLRKHEMVYVFSKPSGGVKTYNPQKTTGHKALGHVKGREYKDGMDSIYEITGTSDKYIDDTRYPTSIQKFIFDKQKIHRTQKPVAMCEWLIKTYSNEGDVVLDFTMGSGSTGLACQNTGRGFIGIEMDEEIFKIAEMRLNDPFSL